MSTRRMTRKYAEWMEDAFTVTIPEWAVVTNDDLRDAFDDLYAASFESKEHQRAEPCTIDTDAGQVEVMVEFLWEDENRQGMEMIDDEIEIESA